MNRRIACSTVLVASLLVLLTWSSVSNAQGSVLYSENFTEYANGTHPPSWTNPHDNWIVENGWYQWNAPPSSGLVVSWYTGLRFGNFVMSATVEGLKYCPNPEGAPVFYVELRGPKSDNVWGYEFGSDVYTMQINKHNLTSSYNLASLHTNGLAAYGSPMQIKVQVDGSSLQYWLTDHNGVSHYLSAEDSEFKVGYLGLATYNCGVEFTNIVVSSL